jgi:hypothetical protein
LLQVYLIHNDPEMFDEVHGKRVECRALNIPEELGQVQYMFCDKAGLPHPFRCPLKKSFRGSGFNQVSASASGSRRAKMTHKSTVEKINKFHVLKCWMFSFKGLKFCSLDVPFCRPRDK